MLDLLRSILLSKHCADSRRNAGGEPGGERGILISLLKTLYLNQFVTICYDFIAPSESREQESQAVSKSEDRLWLAAPARLDSREPQGAARVRSG